MSDESATSRNLPDVVALPAQARSAATPGLTRLRQAIMSLDDERQALAERGDFESLAFGGQAIEVLTAELDTVLRQTRVDVARLLDEREAQRRAQLRAERLEKGAKPEKLPKYLQPGAPLSGVHHIIEGIGKVEVHGGYDRKNWESEKLLRRLLHVALDDYSIFSPDGTDAHDEVYDRLMEVLTDTMPVTPSMQWRVGSHAKPSKDPEGEPTPATGLKKYGIDNDEDWCDRVEKDRLARIPKMERGT